MQYIMFRKNWPFLIALLLFTLLLFKNPFSIRTLISNFEPFPDSFYYLVPARCFTQGKGLTMCLQNGQKFFQMTSWLYSLVQIPVFLINSDARSFYFTNLFLTFASLWVFYLIIKKTTTQQWLQFFVLFLYASSYHLYWLPTLAMAENLLLLIFLLSIYFLFFKSTISRLVVALLIGLAFYFTKSAAIILAPTYIMIYLIKFTVENREFVAKNLKKIIGIFFISTISILFWKANLLKDLYDAIFVNQKGAWFSLQYFPEQFKFYLATIWGQNTRFLWDSRPLYPQWLAIGAILGGLTIRRKHLFLLLTLISLNLSQICFMSLFYSNDARYIIIILPSALLGFALFLEKIFCSYRNIKFYVPTYFLLFIFILYFANNFIRLKSQISLNLKYAETPWWYLSILDYNKFFAQNTFANKPYLIALHSPFLVDFYSNQQYQLLPLSSQQDFRGMSQAVWEIDFTNDLLNIYQEKIKQGEKLFITNYGTSASTTFASDFAQIKNNFILEEKQSGCHNLCNIYQLSL